jgi:hypothetical protein
MSRLRHAIRRRLDAALGRERLEMPLVCRRHRRPVYRRVVSEFEARYMAAGHPLGCKRCGYAVHPEGAVPGGSAVKR